MKRRQPGYSLVEVMIGAALGLLVLSGISTFLWNMSSQFRLGQEQAQVTSRAQQALNRMVKEIKSANTAAPALFNTSVAWSALPALPYSGIELYPYTAVAGTATTPTVPAARKFLSQTGVNDAFHRWYPNPDQAPQESNSLVFYQVSPPGAGGGTADIYRITYRLDAAGPKLIREEEAVQTGGTLASVSTRQTLVESVQSIQFTYPLFAQEMQNNANFETQLVNMPDQQRFLNENFRSVIAIRLVLLGGTLKPGYQAKGIELTTEVRMRN